MCHVITTHSHGRMRHWITRALTPSATTPLLPPSIPGTLLTLAMDLAIKLPSRFASGILPLFPPIETFSSPDGIYPRRWLVRSVTRFLSRGCVILLAVSRIHHPRLLHVEML